MFRLGMEMAGHECVGYCENDKYAIKAYRAIHDVKGEFFAEDIRNIKPEQLPFADIYVGGFPCQSFSTAGKGLGFDDERGTLFFELARLAKERKPSLILLENVKGLLSKPNRQNYAVILSTLDELGYDVEWQVLNSKDFIPQNRERVFIVGHLRGVRSQKVFPIAGKDGRTLKQIVGGSQGSRVYDVDGVSCTLTSNSGGAGAKTGLYLVDDPIPCFYPNKKKLYQHGKRFKNAGDPMFTLTTSDRHGVVTGAIRSGGRGSTDKKHRWDLVSNGKRIRRLTPKECWRLQGMPDWAYERVKEAGISETQLYKQAGNGVTVPVVFNIARKLKIMEA